MTWIKSIKFTLTKDNSRKIYQDSYSDGFENPVSIFIQVILT